MDDVKSWLWHLLHDPIRENPWSMGFLALLSVWFIAAMTVPTAVVIRDGRRARRERETMKLFGKGDDVNEPRHDVESDTQAITDARPVSLADVVTRDGDAQAYEREQAEGVQRAAEQGPVDYEAEGEADPSATQPDPVADSGVHAMPERSPAVLSGHKVQCADCRGYGYVIVSTRELLQESKHLLDDAGDAIVREFYTRLIHLAPHLAPLFPSDLLTADNLKKQREKLLGALVALATLYDPDDPAAMQKLTTALQMFGRSHARFARPDGSEMGATFDEYGIVKQVLFETLHDAAGSQWRPEYDAAWSEAYDFAAVTMLAEQYATVVALARMPRQSADQPLRSALG